MFALLQPDRPTHGRHVFSLLLCLTLAACSTGASPDSGPTTDSPAAAGSTPAGSTAAAGNGSGLPGLGLNLGASSGGSASGGLSDAAPTRCDAAGANCKCIAIANVGAVGSSGTTVSYDTWLNTQSNARVDSYPKPITIDAQFLAKYDELVFQDISTWMITADEVTAISGWVRAGGGLMSMTGYQGSENEVTQINSILAPLGFAYSRTPAGGGVLWQLVNDWNPMSPIATSMNGLGVNVHNGRPVIDLSLGSANDTALLAIAKAANGTAYNLGYTDSVGSGHVFPWADEWVTYTSDWNDNSGTLNVAQFWYNAVRYLTPSNACKVVIDDPNIIVK